LGQKATFSIVALIVSDGCPLRETEAICAAYACTYPNIIYLRKLNGGPSSARNAGIEFILSNLDQIQAAFFLDADNRLSANAIQTAFMALIESPAEVGWVYTDVDTFGIRWSAHFTIPYSPLVHVTTANMCDTGSLVSRRVFEHGIRFDEDARTGFEDWDFWLRCLERGFIGRPISFGLSYRQRPESRNQQHLRDSVAIISHIRSRHKNMSSPDTLLNWEHQTNPRCRAGTGPSCSSRRSARRSRRAG
jgi:glycosyltransferase involved in cell wall biosynthesis